MTRLVTPRYITRAAIDLLEGLLKLNPSERLGIDEAIKHPFLEGIYEEMVEEPVNIHPLEFDFDILGKYRERGHFPRIIRPLIYHEIMMYHSEEERQLHREALEECEGKLFYSYLLKKLKHHV